MRTTMLKYCRLPGSSIVLRHTSQNTVRQSGRSFRTNGSHVQINKSASQRRADTLAAENHPFPSIFDNEQTIGPFGRPPVTYHMGLAGTNSESAGDPYWTKIPLWKGVTDNDFLNYQWQVSV